MRFKKMLRCSMTSLLLQIIHSSSVREEYSNIDSKISEAAEKLAQTTGLSFKEAADKIRAISNSVKNNEDMKFDSLTIFKAAITEPNTHIENNFISKKMGHNKRKF